MTSVKWQPAAPPWPQPLMHLHNGSIMDSRHGTCPAKSPQLPRHQSLLLWKSSLDEEVSMSQRMPVYQQAVPKRGAQGNQARQGLA